MKKYGERHGAVFGLSGAVKGFRIASVVHSLALLFTEEVWYCCNLTTSFGRQVLLLMLEIRGSCGGACWRSERDALLGIGEMVMRIREVGYELLGAGEKAMRSREVGRGGGV